MKEETKGTLFFWAWLIIGVFSILVNMEPVGFILLGVGVFVALCRKIIGYCTAKP